MFLRSKTAIFYIDLTGEKFVRTVELDYGSGVLIGIVRPHQKGFVRPTADRTFQLYGKLTTNMEPKRSSSISIVVGCGFSTNTGPVPYLNSIRY